MKRLRHTQFEEDIPLLPFISHLSDTWGAKCPWEYGDERGGIIHRAPHLPSSLGEPRSPNTEYDIVFQQPPKCKQYMYVLGN